MKDTIGTRIMKLRGQNETQQQLADALGVSRSLVKAWENDDRPVRSDDLVKLASHYGVSCDYLLGLIGEDNATNDEKLRLVCEFTRLSNDAVQSLLEIQAFSQTLSAVLSSELFRYMINEIAEDVEYHYRKSVEALKTLSSADVYSHDPKTIEKDLAAMTEFDDHSMRFAALLFNQSQTWLDILDEMFPEQDGFIGRKKELREMMRSINNG